MVVDKDVGAIQRQTGNTWATRGSDQMQGVDQSSPTLARTVPGGWFGGRIEEAHQLTGNASEETHQLPGGAADRERLLRATVGQAHHL